MGTAGVDLKFSVELSVPPERFTMTFKVWRRSNADLFARSKETDTSFEMLFKDGETLFGTAIACTVLGNIVVLSVIIGCVSNEVEVSLVVVLVEVSKKETRSFETDFTTGGLMDVKVDDEEVTAKTRRVEERAVDAKVEAIVPVTRGNVAVIKGTDVVVTRTNFRLRHPTIDANL